MPTIALLCKYCCLVSFWVLLLRRDFYWQKYSKTKQPTWYHIRQDPSILQGGLVLEPQKYDIDVVLFVLFSFFWEEGKKKTVFDKSVSSLTSLERVYSF